jgi:hypothetical protein
MILSQYHIFELDTINIYSVLTHRSNMELDLQSLFGLHVHSCIHWLGPRIPPPLVFGLICKAAYWSAKIR